MANSSRIAPIVTKPLTNEPVSIFAIFFIADTITNIAPDIIVKAIAELILNLLLFTTFKNIANEPSITINPVMPLAKSFVFILLNVLTALARITTDVAKANSPTEEVFNFPPNLEITITVVARVANIPTRPDSPLISSSGSIVAITLSAPANAKTDNAKAGNTVEAYKAVLTPPVILDIEFRVIVIANRVAPRAAIPLDKSCIGIVDNNLIDTAITPIATPILNKVSALMFAVMASRVSPSLLKNVRLSPNPSTASPIFPRISLNPSPSPLNFLITIIMKPSNPPVSKSVEVNEPKNLTTSSAIFCT